MIKINYMSTLFVGIDVSSKSNVVCAMDFDENRYISFSFSNNQPGADELAVAIADCMRKHHDLNTISNSAISGFSNTFANSSASIPPGTLMLLFGSVPVCPCISG